MIMKNGVINDYLIKKIKILKIKTCVYDLSVVNSKQKKMNQIVNVLILSGLGPGPSYQAMLDQAKYKTLGTNLKFDFQDDIQDDIQDDSLELDSELVD